MKRASWLMLTLGACASVDPSPRLAEVSRQVESRGGLSVAWDQHRSEDSAVEDRVKALLAKDLTADAAVEVALLRNRTLQATYESVGMAQADLVQAGLLQNPTLGASVRFPLKGPGSVELEGSLVQNFLSLFTLPLRKRFAEQEVTRAVLRVGNAVLDLEADVRADFVRVQAAQQLAELHRAFFEAEQTSAELAQGQFTAGNIAELELVSRLAAAEQERLELATAENAVLEAKEQLVHQMGVFGRQAHFEMTTTLPEIPREEVPLDHLEAKAIGQRLDLEASRAEVLGLRGAWELASGTRWFTSLDVGVSGGRDSEGTTLLGPTLSVELPIFDQHQARLATLEAQLRAAQARQEGLALDVRSDVRRASVRLQAARGVVEHYRKVLLPLRERAVALSQEHYNSMLLGVYGLLQSKQQQITAYRAFIEAVRDYWVARSDLERALGGRLPAPPSPSTQPLAQIGVTP